MKKILGILLFVFLNISLLGCSNNLNFRIKEIVDDKVVCISEYQHKEIAYLKTDNVIVDDVEFNDVYVVKAVSKVNINYNINLILDMDMELKVISSYILNSNNELDHVYEMAIFIDNQEINDDMYTNFIK